MSGILEHPFLNVVAFQVEKLEIHKKPVLKYSSKLKR